MGIRNNNKKGNRKQNVAAIDRREMKDTLKEIGVLAVVLVIGLQFFQPTRVFGVSMLPNFKENDYLIISTEAYHSASPKRGDVIVFKAKSTGSSSGSTDSSGEQLWIKRVVGLPGETVTVKGGKVYINGKEISQSYTKDGTTSGDVNVTVGKDEYFCMGDNRLRSLDSRDSSVGCIKKSSIKGKVIFRLYPLNKIGRISGTN